MLLSRNKIKAIITETYQKIAWFKQSDGIIVYGSILPFASKLRFLRVTIDSLLSFIDHITGAIPASNYHIRALCHIRSLIDRDTANTIACLVIFLRLSYFNAILYRVTDHNLNWLQCTCAELPGPFYLPYRSVATRLRRSLHWLPIRQRIECKVVLLTFKVRLHQPTYLSKLVANQVPTRLLRSAYKARLVLPCTKMLTASRAFSVAASRTWKSAT